MCIGAVYYAALLFYKSQFKQNTHTKKQKQKHLRVLPKGNGLSYCCGNNDILFLNLVLILFSNMLCCIKSLNFVRFRVTSARFIL